MKILVKDYAFNKDNKTITFTGNLYPLSLEEILLITNVTTGDIIYNFADKLRGGSLSGKVLTLITDTSKMSNTDELQIFVDSDEYQNDVLVLLNNILQNTNFARDAASRMRVTIENSPMLITLMRNSYTQMAGSGENWYSVNSCNTIDLREQLMSILNQNLMIHMQRWVRS